MLNLSLLANFNGRLGASDGVIDEIEARLRLKLPSDYVNFLRFANGGEGFIGNSSYAMLWRIEELIQFNLDYEVERWAPGFLAFGSDGAGEAFGFDTREVHWPVMQMPWIGMNWTDAEPVAGSFSEFLLRLSERE